MNISTVIVTHNRKKQLARCIQAVINQTVKIKSIFIIDNASTDETKRYLKKMGFVSESPSNSSILISDTTIHYIRLVTNSGGAGGFNAGMQRAYKTESDFIWIMDDDGFPHKTCLEKQLKLTDRYKYIMPISLSIKTKDYLTWFIRCKNKKLTRSYSELKESFPEGLIHHAVPFNGLLIPHNVVTQVGFPKKEMFIWGDDFEYQYRCIQNGIQPVTVLNAIFYHPEDKASCHRVFFDLIPIIYTESKLRFTCLIRNSTYNYWNYNRKHLICIKFLLYTWLFLVQKNFATKEYIHYLRCVKDGIKGDFTRHLAYIEE